MITKTEPFRFESLQQFVFISSSSSCYYVENVQCVLETEVFTLFWQLVEEERVKGVVSMNEDYELKWLANAKQVRCMFLCHDLH